MISVLYISQLSINLNVSANDFDIKFIVSLMAFSILSYFTFRRLIKRMLPKIGISDKYYSKYVKPHRFIKKLFGIKEKYIPKFIYIECFFSLFFLHLFTVNLIAYIFFDIFTIAILYITECVLILINFVWFSIMCYVFRK